MKSVGFEAVNNVCVVFTKLSIDSAEVAREKASMIVEEFKVLGVQCPGNQLPFWFLDNCPEITNKAMKSALSTDIWNSTISGLQKQRDETIQ